MGTLPYMPLQQKRANFRSGVSNGPDLYLFPIPMQQLSIIWGHEDARRLTPVKSPLHIYFLMPTALGKCCTMRHPNVTYPPSDVMYDVRCKACLKRTCRPNMEGQQVPHPCSKTPKQAHCGRVADLCICSQFYCLFSGYSITRVKYSWIRNGTEHAQIFQPHLWRSIFT